MIETIPPSHKNREDKRQPIATGTQCFILFAVGVTLGLVIGSRTPISVNSHIQQQQNDEQSQSSVADLKDILIQQHKAALKNEPVNSDQQLNLFSTDHDNLIYLVRPSAFARLDPSYSNHYYLLDNGLDAQINQAFCGVATAAAVINSLRSDHNTTALLPIDPVYAPYPYATQVDMFNACVSDNVISSPEGILTPPFGLSLEQVKIMLQCSLGQGWNVESVGVNPGTVTANKMRDDLKKVLKDSDKRVLVNFHRLEIGQVGGGHFSPIGSYHPATDSFLILDVAKYKHPPVWVPAEILHTSLSTVDNCGKWDYPSAQSKLPENWRGLSKNERDGILGCEENWRGYIVVSKRTN